MKKVLGIIGIILIIGALVVGAILGVKGFGLGKGKGSGEGTQTTLSDTTNDKKNDQVVIIKVKESNIYINDEQCTSVDVLKEKISAIDSKNKQATYKFEQEYAIKATYDEVKKTLSDLEEVLGIHVEYKE